MLAKVERRVAVSAAGPLAVLSQIALRQFAFPH
jgi:hypothetical protein